MVFERIDGRPIDQCLPTSRDNLPRILGVIDKVCDAPSAEHQHFVIHRDIKPGNVQVDADGQVTLRQLLHHTSGIKDFLRSVPATQPLLTQNLPIERLLATVEPEAFEFKPGEAMGYSNIGYVLLGLVVEKSSGMPYKEYVEEHLLKPAGMTTAASGTTTAW